MNEHNEHYWLKGRNGWTPTSTWQEEEVTENKRNQINPKMLLSKEELKGSKKKISLKFDWHLDKVVERITDEILLRSSNRQFQNFLSFFKNSN